MLMSYQIYYDRAYIRIGEKYIPLVNSGSNNSFEYGLYGRHICEKSWNVLNWKHRNQFLFTESEIRDIAHDYDQYNQESGTMYKTRNQRFAPGEMERWIINGMRRSFTVEEYVSFGNRFSVLDYSPSETKDWKHHPFTTTTGLLATLDRIKDCMSLEIKLEDNREVYRPKTIRAPRKKLRSCDLPECYVLRGEVNGITAYFAGLTQRGGFKYYGESQSNCARLFLTEKDANRYLKKYHNRLVTRYNFTPERIGQ